MEINENRCGKKWHDDNKNMYVEIHIAHQPIQYTFLFKTCIRAYITNILSFRKYVTLLFLWIDR